MPKVTQVAVAEIGGKLRWNFSGRTSNVVLE